MRIEYIRSMSLPKGVPVPHYDTIEQVVERYLSADIVEAEADPTAFRQPGQGELASATITAPEFQLCNEVTVAAYLNFINTVIDSGRNDVAANYAGDEALSDDPEALVQAWGARLSAVSRRAEAIVGETAPKD